MLGQKPESLVDSFLLSAMKAIGTFLKVKNVEALQKDLKNDMVNAELSTRPCWLTLRCGSWLSPASGASSRRYHGGWRCLKRCDFHWWNLPRKNFFGWKWCRRQKVRPSSIKHPMLNTSMNEMLCQLSCREFCRVDVSVIYDEQIHRNNRCWKKHHDIQNVFQRAFEYCELDQRREIQDIVEEKLLKCLQKIEILRITNHLKET